MCGKRPKDVRVLLKLSHGGALVLWGNHRLVACDDGCPGGCGPLILLEGRDWTWKLWWRARSGRPQFPAIGHSSLFCSVHHHSKKQAAEVRGGVDELEDDSGDPFVGWIFSDLYPPNDKRYLGVREIFNEADRYTHA